MFNLLRADFIRLFKYKPFITLISLTAAMAVYLNLGQSSSLNTPDAYFIIYPFEIIVYFSFIIAAAVSFFGGINFSEGVVRNKLFTGYSKVQIYLSNAVVCAFMSALLGILTMMSGIWLVVYDKTDALTLLTYTFAATAVCVTFSILTSAVTFICRGKAVPLVATAIIIVAMFGITTVLGKELSISEYEHVVKSVDGVNVEDSDFYAITGDSKITYETVKNDSYIKPGAKRTVLEEAYKMLPTAQLLGISEICYDSEDPECIYRIENSGSNFASNAPVTSPTDAFKSVNILYCLILQAILLTAGALIFRKKDLN